MATTHHGAPHPPNVAGFRHVRPRHSHGYRFHHTLRTVLICILAVVLVTPGSAAAMAWFQINHLVEESGVKVLTTGKHKELPKIDPNAGKTINILLIGQDTRDGKDNAALGDSDGTDANSHQADTTIIVQISADRSYINMVSIPRDSIVNAPSCQTSKGTMPARYSVMFNSIFAEAWNRGGDVDSAASCAMAAVNDLTGLDIPDFAVVDFRGLVDMIDANGGVDICVPVDTDDDYTDLHLERGLQHLDGIKATQYARMRHGTGTDGSDIMRTTRQQYLIKELIKQAMHKNLLTHSDELYRLSTTALKSINISENMANTNVLVGLAMSLRNLDTNRIYSQTVPVIPAPSNPNRVIWSDQADGIWEKMRQGQALTDAPEPATNKEANDGGSDGVTPQAPEDAEPQPDPQTGLITNSDGSLTDPNTGGTVDPENGSIHDPNTGQYIGIADRYLNLTVCAVPAKS
ncbi:transcriptional regulator [Bifidobacterium aemilianum]|uniref:Transcriptional regulator n=1 Tax=Bifidobacterium aemilianum TaxID=2493120 RepID=A0A366K9V4_9BIFI|nr:LCP family protein [Bifidobacterium aemilianum]RBP98107.1 transcriptional regulator [Bifidobacterium aemilianum]